MAAMIDFKVDLFASIRQVVYNYLVQNYQNRFEDRAPRHDSVLLESFERGTGGDWRASAWTLDDLDLLFLLDYDSGENICYVNVYRRELEFSVGGSYNAR